MKRKKSNEKKLSLMEAYPSLAEEWHPGKNDILTPHDVTPADYIHAWWICHVKHEWIATVKDRVDGAGCPFCHHTFKKYTRRVSLASAQPEAIKFWHPEKNGDRTPDQFGPRSNIKVWWKCEKGHDWYAAIVSMRLNPHCRCCHPGFKASHNYNLAVKRPDLARRWHPGKNGSLLPSHITPSSAKKVWWVCEKGHEFMRTTSSMNKYQNCPVCRQLYLDEKFKLQSHNPELAREWHPVKNGDLTPDKVSAFASIKVWWLCPKGHEYQASVLNRNSSMKRGGKGTGCPYCVGRKDLSKESLAILRPDLAKEWHPGKNRGLTPEKVSTVNMRWVWWRCKNGHEWLAPIRNRVHGKKWATCPHCKVRNEKTKKQRR